ncbi:thylakoid lumen protein [Dunaliella salina]|uniref:Thylakoid lumen protein n=1 Tax=Dunaliella salina TaxID=3046 RepID=A0ABQ7GAW6_DUNSA|nr:thylakoid lumen protein [Dunaliella salina]|eukprot:KAF5831745.1 thylakoid lumen protein [Dunaliella salina]
MFSLKHTTSLAQAIPQSTSAVPAVPTPRTQCRALPKQQEAQCLDRRELLGCALASTVPALALQPSPAFASGNIPKTEKANDEYAIFYGYATPPTSYGGYGGTANEPPKYTFEYPAPWKIDIPSKSEKGTKGIDGRVISDKGTKGIQGKGQRAFVITLGRAGEDNKAFKLSDLDTTFSGFSTADYDLQDALALADDVVTGQRQVTDKDGTLTFYTYDIISPVNRYLASIGVKYGKVYALFVKSPAKEFEQNEGQLRHIIDTFRLVDNGYA